MRYRNIPAAPRSSRKGVLQHDGVVAVGRGAEQHDGRFHQLLDLAREGDLGAIAELWNRYGYRFPEDEP